MIIDMKPIDGNSDQASNDLLPKLYDLFFDWPKPLNNKQIEEKLAAEEKERETSTLSGAKNTEDDKSDNP